VGALKHLGIVPALGVFVSAAPMILGIAIAFRPTEQSLALMRPLSLAAIFVTISNTMLGLVQTFAYISSRPAPVSFNILSAQLAETLVIPFVGFGCLTVAWLGVAMGTRRQP
jgi:hypothetical protein